MSAVLADAAVADAITPLNDVHSKLNASTPVDVFQPKSVEAARDCIARCARNGWSLAVMGAGHAMGGQQFLDGGHVLDTRYLDRPIALDAERGLATVEAGIRWPALMAWLQDHPDNRMGWAIRQKQTGADDLSLGGALAANVHGRGLCLAPIVDDVEAFDLIDAEGRLLHVNREQNAELFRLVIGGYGLFGLIVRVTLRLTQRTTLRREVREIRVPELIEAFDAAIAAGCTFGDFQFAVDSSSPDFLQLGILSCYRPVVDAVPDSAPRHLGQEDFHQLLHLAHVDPSTAYQLYRDFYLSSHGQLYASDAQQAGIYLGAYHSQIDAKLGHTGSEMISELYVPRPMLAAFMQRAAASLRRLDAQVIYGTVRLIERDTTTQLAWARGPWACVIFNLHVEHSEAGIARAADAFRALIDDALEFGGSYYLTYHRWARREQLLAAHPALPDFMAAKRQHDPELRWTSDWYRHLHAMLAA